MNEPILDRLKVPAADESRKSRALERSLVALRNVPRIFSRFNHEAEGTDGVGKVAQAFQPVKWLKHRLESLCHTSGRREIVMVGARTERKPHRAAWLFAFAAAVAACVVVALVMHCKTADSSPRVFAELEHLFPGQLLAVLRNGGQTDLRLSAIPDPELSTDQRVRITVRSGGETTDIVTYSGREICVPLKTGPLCLTPLVTGEGDVLVLTGDNAFTRNGRIHSATIRATALTSS